MLLFVNIFNWMISLGVCVCGYRRAHELVECDCNCASKITINSHFINMRKKRTLIKNAQNTQTVQNAEIETNHSVLMSEA